MERCLMLKVFSTFAIVGYLDTGSIGEMGVRGISGAKGISGPPGPVVGLHRLAHYQYLDQSVENLKTILYMSSTVENMKFPVGSKENPAMTCKELMDVDDIQDGYFWIDPNLGCPADAVRVYCNFTAGGETCVPPFREKITYKASTIQFNFLRLLSTRVRQHVTVKCKRIVVWFHRVTKSYRYSWIFHGRKGFDFTATSKLKPKVIRDYCQAISHFITYPNTICSSSWSPAILPFLKYRATILLAVDRFTPIVAATVK
ncbi:collagen alpha-1(XXVII) chain-like [Acropora millepora]|uniref:collagen alpha-1(XXVII) chain-like n=1 Tax=Acropora millepora TaxID=45264 RepID=UPI001CF55FE0|nr:collagen alpha-1(XXVII) chain-like [Acropora millepora]